MMPIVFLENYQGEYSFKLDPQELMENLTIREQPVNFLVGIEATYLVLWGPIDPLPTNRNSGGNR